MVRNNILDTTKNPQIEVDFISRIGGKKSIYACQVLTVPPAVTTAEARAVRLFGKGSFFLWISVGEKKRRNKSTLNY